MMIAVAYPILSSDLGLNYAREIQCVQMRQTLASYPFPPSRILPSEEGHDVFIFQNMAVGMTADIVNQPIGGPCMTIGNLL
jgi:hypothetical protein